MKELPFNLLLDKYRKELLNLGRFNKTIEQRDYWLLKSNDTYNRLIEMYNEANNSGR